MHYFYKKLFRNVLLASVSVFNSLYTLYMSYVSCLSCVWLISLWFHFPDNTTAREIKKKFPIAGGWEITETETPGQDREWLTQCQLPLTILSVFPRSPNMKLALLFCLVRLSLSVLTELPEQEPVEHHQVPVEYYEGEDQYQQGLFSSLKSPLSTIQWSLTCLF